MEKLLEELAAVFKGDITTDIFKRKRFSHDASIFELLPEAVLAPKTTLDIKHLVRLTAANKAAYPELSITPRSAGTDMSGGAIGNSLLIDMTKHFSKIKAVSEEEITVQPGTYIRDIEPLVREEGAMLPSVPASRELCTIGGMVGNNAGGEQSLRYGNTEKHVRSLKIVFADGNEYSVKPLNRRQLERKMNQGDYEGNLYKSVFNLIENHYDIIKNARPRVSKNSMGYNLWSVWDRETGIFDMTRLITGSQGTLGIITEITYGLVPKAPHSGLLVIYLSSTKHLGQLIPAVMKHGPATFEGFDDVTFELGIRYFKIFKAHMGTRQWLKQQASLLGTVAKFKGHLPNMVLMVEFEGKSPAEVQNKIAELQKSLTWFNIKTEIAGNEESSSKFWEIRRASLSLLRQRVHDKYAAPFIDDLTVQPKYLHEFLPELRKIIRKYGLPATTAGHFGDGNFHIIPLMKIEDPKEQAKLEPTMKEIIPLVLKYSGTLAGEHNDGMVRGPWLPTVFGDEIFQLFRQTKQIFDPQNIFNPHKKTDADWSFSKRHIRTSNKGELIKE